MARTAHHLLRDGSICACLVTASLVFLGARRPRLAGLCWLGVGFGGLGAAWGRYSERCGDWLGFDVRPQAPHRDELRVALEHAPFVVAGAITLLRSR